ncbi:MAG: hypothetical protein ACI9W2_003288 [Gammaproteobacteria bacterium]|jgi:hypothetical protein
MFHPFYPDRSPSMRRCSAAAIWRWLAGRGYFSSLVIGLSLMLCGQAHAQELPSTMVVFGTLLAGEGLTPQINDQVLLVGLDGTVEGIGSVRDASGIYAIESSKSASFNGTTLVMRLRRLGVDRRLLVGGVDAGFQFNGGLFPTRLLLNPTIGPLVEAPVAPPEPSPGGGGATPPTDGGATPPTDGGATPPTGGGDDAGGGEDGPSPAAPASPFDIDGDGQFDQRDIDLVKSVVAGKTEASERSDINGDGITNTRDIIDIIKARRAQNRPGR